jgi:hypothetical protein
MHDESMIVLRSTGLSTKSVMRFLIPIEPGRRVE